MTDIERNKKECAPGHARGILMEKQSRIKYWDLLRGIAIFLVVWGHTIQFGGSSMELFANKAFIFIYSFHMPLFLLISGYFLAKSAGRRSLVQNLGKKLVHIAVPAVLGGAGFYVVKLAVERLLGSDAYPISAAMLFEEIGNIWFLWCMFMCSVALLAADALVRKLGSSKMMPVILAAVFVLFVFLPYSEYNLYLFPYFLTGYAIEKAGAENKNLKKLSRLELFSIVLFPMLLQNFSERHFIYSSGIRLFSSVYGAAAQLAIDVFRWLIGFAGCFVVLMFARKLEEAFPTNKICDLIGDIGKYTLEIYILERIVVEYLGAKVLWKMVNGPGSTVLGNDIVYSYLFTPLCSIAFTLLLYYIVKGAKSVWGWRNADKV